MILGLSLAAFTNLHVVISLVAIAAGLWLCTAMINGRHLPGGAAFFLIATALTSITGYFFPNAGVTPGQIVGGISLVALALAAAALYAFELRGYWRAVYVIGSVLALERICRNSSIVPEDLTAGTPCPHSVRTAICDRTSDRYWSCDHGRMARVSALSASAATLRQLNRGFFARSAIRKLNLVGSKAVEQPCPARALEVVLRAAAAGAARRMR